MSDEIHLQLRELRQARQLSQEDLARELGVSRQSIISLEQGEYQPSFAIFLEMLKFFQCPIDDLVEGVRFTLENNNEYEKGGEQKQMPIVGTKPTSTSRIPMSISLWSPFQAIDQLHDEMNDMVDRTLGRADWSRMVGSAVGAMNIHEDDKEYEIHIQAPGFKEDEVSIEVGEDGVLTVTGAHKEEQKAENKKSVIRREWEHAEFSRSIRFSQPIMTGKVEAKMADGTLTVIAPKEEPVKPKTMRVAIKKS